MDILLVYQILFYTPTSMKLEGGILVSPCPSVCLLWMEWCLFCVNNTCWIHFIFIHLIKQLQKMCHMYRFLQNSKMLIFGIFFYAPTQRSWWGVYWIHLVFFFVFFFQFITLTLDPTWISIIRNHRLVGYSQNASILVTLVDTKIYNTSIMNLRDFRNLN